MFSERWKVVLEFVGVVANQKVFAISAKVVLNNRDVFVFVVLEHILGYLETFMWFDSALSGEFYRAVNPIVRLHVAAFARIFKILNHVVKLKIAYSEFVIRVFYT